MGRSCPAGGKETRSCGSTVRPGYGNTRGLTEITSVGGLVESFAASPVNAWSVGFRRMDPSLNAVAIVSCFRVPKCSQRIEFQKIMIESSGQHLQNIILPFYTRFGSWSQRKSILELVRTEASTWNEMIGTSLDVTDQQGVPH